MAAGKKAFNFPWTNRQNRSVSCFAYFAWNRRHYGEGRNRVESTTWSPAFAGATH